MTGKNRGTGLSYCTLFYGTGITMDSETKKAKIAVFIDAENLKSYLDEKPLEGLFEDFVGLGHAVMRRAYAKWNVYWTNEDGPTGNYVPTMQYLNEQGFELIQTYHPIGSKNSTDIAITIDVMATAADPGIEWFALLTGDSDFLPLFRRLRTLGKKLIGCGARGRVSEIVKKHCDKFYFTDVSRYVPGEEADVKSEETRALLREEAVEVLNKALAQCTEPVVLPQLKSLIMSIDSSFDLRTLGFEKFSDFLRCAGVRIGRNANNAEVAPFDGEDAETANSHGTSLQEQYRTYMRGMKWRFLPASRFDECVTVLAGLPSVKFSELEDKAADACPNIPKTDFIKAVTMLFKAGLFQFVITNDGEKFSKLADIPLESIKRAVDLALLKRLFSKTNPEAEAIRPLLLGEYTQDDLEALLGQARYKVQ
jgi:hypothetical protein